MNPLAHFRNSGFNRPLVVIIASAMVGFGYGSGFVGGEHEVDEPFEILERLVQTGERVSSFRTRMQASIERSGSRRDLDVEEIVVGDDKYSRTAESGDATELLLYKGTYYRRGAAGGAWMALVPDADPLIRGEKEGFSATYRRPILVYEPSRSLFSRRYNFDFGWISEVTSANREMRGGEPIIILTGRLSAEVRPADSTEIQESLIAFGVDQKAVEHILDPLSVSGTIGLLINANDFYLTGMQIQSTYFGRTGEIVSFDSTTQFTDFNEPLHLPGPLPEGQSR